MFSDLDYSFAVQLNLATLATFTFFVISVLQCFPALFHCFANHVLLFQKYKFHSFMFVSQGFAKFHK